MLRRESARACRFAAAVWAFGCLTALLTPAATARPKRPKPAATPPSETRTWGNVLSIDKGEVVVDLGSEHGLAAGQRLLLYRTVRVKHPVTGAAVEDRFPIDEAVALEVATRLTLLRPNPKQLRYLQVGDRVEIVIIEPIAIAKAATATDVAATSGGPTRGAEADANRCPPVTVTKVDARRPDELEADALFRRTLGQIPANRITLWRAFLRRYPGSSLRASIQSEITMMSELASDSRLAQGDRDRRTRAETLRRQLFHANLSSMHVGQPAWVVLSAADWENVADVRIYYRAKDSGQYEMVRPEPSGMLHLRARLPDALVTPPGFEYFIAITNGDGQLTTMAGSAKVPTQVEVDDPFSDIGARRRGASSLRWVTEWIDWNRMRGDDRTLFAELEVSYRLRFGALYAFSLGYGFLNGRGGRVAESDSPEDAEQPFAKDDTLDPHGASFKYAWLATEFEFHELFHVTTRFAVGLDAGGLNTGLELLARIGAERGTNIQLGYGTMADMGRLATIGFTARALEDVPMGLVFQVTSQPVASDLGIRLVYEAGVQLTDMVALNGRIGWNLRTIRHAGPSGGLGMSFQW